MNGWRGRAQKTSETITKLCAFATLAACVFGCEAAPRPGNLIIRAGRLLDGSGGPVQENVRVVVQDGEITRIEADQGELPTGQRVIDARDLTVMPGLVDAHVHLAGTGACSPGVGVGVGQMARNLYALLAAGVTTVADFGAPIELALGLRGWSGTGRSRGPRVLIAGPMLTAAGGYLTEIADGLMVDRGAIVEIATPDEGRQKVRELVGRGVDFIKVGLQEKGFDGKSLPLLDEKRLCAIVEEAHKLEMRVLAHATESRSYELALSCGVDGIGHGPLEPLTADLADRLAAAGVPVAPTLFVFAAMLWGPQHLDYIETITARRVLSDAVRNDLLAYVEADRAGGEFLPPFFMPGISRRRATAASAELRRNVQTLHQRGVPLSLGTAAAVCFVYMGSEPEELRRLVDAGLTPKEALVVATSGGARMLNLHDAIGRISPHFRADIITVEGRPDERIEDLKNIREVIIDGIVQQPQAPGIARFLSLAAQLSWRYTKQ